MATRCETDLMQIEQNPTDDKSALVQVMAWCSQATRLYLNQFSPKYMSPHGVTRQFCFNQSWMEEIVEMSS